MTGEDRAGLYITVIFHLLVIIVLLASQISSALRKGESFLIDFSKQEIIEEKKKEENLKEEVKQKLDRMLDSYAGVPIRNIAVDRSSTLKDDRNTNAEELYKEAERLARELENGYEIDEPDDYIPISKPVSQTCLAEERTPEEAAVQRTFRGILRPGRQEGQQTLDPCLQVFRSRTRDRHHHGGSFRKRREREDTGRCVLE